MGFEQLPEDLFDNVLQFIDIKDIINFSHTSVEHKTFVEKITSNSQKLVSKVFGVTDIMDIETWIFLETKNMNMKHSKQYYDIYRNMARHYELSINEIKQIYYNLLHCIKTIYILEEDDEVQLQNDYIIKALFSFTKSASHIFRGQLKGNNREWRSRAFMLDTLFKIISWDIYYVDIFYLESMIIEMLEDYIEYLTGNVEDNEYTTDFLVEYYEGFFYYNSNNKNENMISIKHLLMDVITESELSHLFLFDEDSDEIPLLSRDYDSDILES